jgi:hypothetical protein
MTAALAQGTACSMRASDFVRREQNTLLGFFVLHLPSGLTLHGCTLHRKGDKTWVGLPGKPQLTQDNRVRCDPATNKPLYTPVVEIIDREARERFQRQALEAVRKLIGSEGGDL